MNSSFIEKLNNKLNMIELTSKPIVENDAAWQQHGTPDIVIDMMLDMYYKNGEFKNNERILILFNVEFIKQIYFKYRDELIFGNLYFIADSQEKFDIVKRLYPNVHCVLCDQHNIENLIKKIGEFNVKKFDIVFSNPPYNDGLDLKILSNIKNTFKKAIIVHPAVWILENKCVGYIGKFKKEFQNNIEKVVIFRGSDMFGVGFMSALDICVFNTEKLDSKIEVDDQVVNCKYIANNHIDITQYGDMWLKLNIKKFIEKFHTEKSILRHVYFDRDHLENLTYPIKLSECRSGNPHFNDGYYDEKLGYYVLNKTNCFFTCIAKGDPEKYHFNCDWTNKHNQTLLFNFISSNERFNFYVYAKSKFFRFLISLYKVNMANVSSSGSPLSINSKLDGHPMKLIPWLDFTQEWDDAKLCKEFGISEELWNYIDNFIPDYYDDYKSGFEK